MVGSFQNQFYCSGMVAGHNPLRTPFYTGWALQCVPKPSLFVSRAGMVRDTAATGSCTPFSRPRRVQAEIALARGGYIEILGG